jgi:GTPase-associated adaptor domain
MTDVSVALNGEQRRATIVFAELSDLASIDEWKDKLGADTDSKRRDAVDLAQLARDGFWAHTRIQQIYVNSVEEITTRIENDEHVELAGLLLLKCDWFPDSGVIGICHFRRSWCNSIILDYLAVHPFIAKAPDDYPYIVSGAGSALLWFVSDIARRNKCGRLWGEATHGSRGYYKHMFDLEAVEDLILADKLHYLECAKKELLWRAEGEANKMKAEIKELYKVEAENPPLIGRLSFVVSPSRTLAYHFLQLQTHVQMQIAKVFGLPREGEEGLRDDLLFRALFRQATESKKLSDLWREVETKHPKGRPEENPFR